MPSPYLERARSGDGFVCDHCGTPREPYRFANRPGVCRCRHIATATRASLRGTVMERTHTPLSVWFWAAYLVTSQTPGCRPPSSSGNSDCRVTRLLSRFFTNCRPAWCAPTRIGLAATPENTPKPMKFTPAAILAARAAVKMSVWQLAYPTPHRWRV